MTFKKNCISTYPIKIKLLKKKKKTHLQPPLPLDLSSKQPTHLNAGYGEQSCGVRTESSLQKWKYQGSYGEICFRVKQFYAP